MSYKYCPHCGGQLPPPLKSTFGDSPGYASFQPLPEPLSDPEPAAKVEPAEYNQDKEWRRVIELAESMRIRQDPPETLYPPDFTSGKTVVHMAFDASVCPTGGLMHNLILSLSPTQPIERSRLTPKELGAMGYIADEEGKIELASDIPIGPIYKILQYWGAGRQYKRWHMTKPVELNPSKNGNPCFMDENMVAFVAHWKDSTKMATAIDELNSLMASGKVGSLTTPKPRLIDLIWVR